MGDRTVLPAICLLIWAALFGASAASELGDVPAGGFRSPEGDTRFTPDTGVKPLNNLVSELLNQESPGSTQYRFRNPRKGWVYVRVLPDGNNPPAAVLLDGVPVALKVVDGVSEAMRYVAEGPHTVGLASNDETVKRLEVRSIGELFYATYGNNPHIKETGVYTWDFLRRHCLDHYNGIIGASALASDGTYAQEAELQEWTADGKRWYTLESVPYDVETADEAYARWSKSLGMQHPRMSGIWADEFGVGEKYGKKTTELYPVWTEAIGRLAATPAFADRAFYAYGPSRLLPAESFEEMFPFVQAILKSDYRLGPEWYLPEGRTRPGRPIAETGDLLAEFSPGWEQASRASFERASPGAAMDRVVVVALFSEPGWETCDLYPDCDFNVFLDAQLQFIATDPAFFGVRGLQGYLSGYCGEEQTRLFARLVRHYAIEGNTKRMLKDPYVLKHIENADLADGMEGWTITPAVAGSERQSIAIKSVPGLGVLEGKYHAQEGVGNTALWTCRSTDRPNVISQQIRNLTPGRLYSLRLLTSDYQELNVGKSTPRKHAVSVTIEDAECVDEKSFQAVVCCAYWHPYGKFDANNPYWMNYHQLVFRAGADTAKLRLSDWASAESAAGPDNEELIWNFIQVQPYFE